METPDPRRSSATGQSVSASGAHRKRYVARAAGVILAACGSLSALLVSTGANDPGSFYYLGAGAALLILACLFWEIVEIRTRGSRSSWVNGAAWFAFPGALFAAFLSLPFLAIAVYPPLSEVLMRRERAEAFIVARPEGRVLEIWFPLEMKAAGNMLRIDDVLVDAEYQAAHPEHFRWVGKRTFTVALEPVSRDLKLGKVRTLSLNSDLQALRTSGAWRLFRFANGDRLPPQVVTVR